MLLVRAIAAGVLAAGWLVPLTAAGSPIGDVIEVVNLATHQLPGQSKLQARLADPLFRDELLETARDARLRVGFIDGSILVLEASSQAVLDRHLLDPAAAGTGDAVNLLTGLFQFASGADGDEGLTLQTPVTIIDLRGTSLEIAVRAGGATEVTVVDGAAFLAPLGRGKGALVEAGQMGRVASPDADVEVIDITMLVVPAAGGQHEQATSPDPDAPDPPRGNSAPDPPAPDPPAPDPPAPDPPAPGSKAPGQNNDTTNNSGHSDGTNPGQGGIHGHDNGGSSNPGN